MGQRCLRFVLGVVLVLSVAACGGDDDPAVDLASSAPTAVPEATPPMVSPTQEPESTVAATQAPAAKTGSPATAKPTPTPYQTQVTKGCTVSAAAPPYDDTGDFVRVAITGSCVHMRKPDTGEIKVEVDGKDHGEVNDVPKFDENGYFSAKPFITQDGKVCGHMVTITVSGKYDFANNKSDVGSTTFKLVCS